MIVLDAKDHAFLVSSYSIKVNRFTRRGCIQVVCASFAANSYPHISNAKATTAVNPLENLVEAQETLDTLLTNYKRATVDCTFADVPRELLETKNKELLLEKAATNALFDKSASIETCKTTNRIVRNYLGVTGKGTCAVDTILLILLKAYIIRFRWNFSLNALSGDTDKSLFLFAKVLWLGSRNESIRA